MDKANTPGSRSKQQMQESCRIPLSFLDLFLPVGFVSIWTDVVSSECSTYQSPHSAVQRVPVIPSEFWIGAFQRRISVGLWPLDSELASYPVTRPRNRSDGKRLRGYAPIPVSLLDLIVLRRVL